jgi:hypothetical protein
MTDNDLELELEDKQTTVEEVLSRWNDVLHAITDIVTRDRTIVRILVFSFIVDILLTVFIGFGAVHLHDISNQYQILSCHSGNSFRSATKGSWEDLLRILTPKNPTVGWYKFIHSFQLDLNKTYAPRNCKL